VNLAGTASDNIAVSNITWRIDGGAYGAAGVGGTVTNWTVSGIALSPGAHTIDVKATDTAGNSTFDTIVVTRDTTAPTVSISNPTAAATYITNATPMVLGGTASDNIALAS